MGPALKELIVGVGEMGENSSTDGCSTVLWVCRKRT